MTSALAAALVVGSLAGLAEVTPENPKGDDVITLCLLPFYFIAAVLTHYAEDTSEPLIYLLAFLFFFGMTYLAQVVWLHSRRGSREP